MDCFIIEQTTNSFILLKICCISKEEANPMILKYTFLIINFPKKILFFNEGKCKNFLEYLEMFLNV